MGNPVVHFEIVGKEPERLRTFYKDAFVWEIGARRFPAPARSITQSSSRSAIGAPIRPA